MRWWRLCGARWAATAFDGEGARLFAGRWHHAGTPVVYCASSRSLAALEMLVHLDPSDAPDDWVLIPADVPPDLIRETPADALPDGWNALPVRRESRDLGSGWMRRGDSVGLLVPSVVVAGEKNLLLNPRHPGFSAVTIGSAQPFSFDPRLL